METLTNNFEKKKKLPPISIILSGVFLLIIITWVIFPSVFAPNALALDIKNTKLPAGSEGHLLGTDALGRDVAKMLIAGSSSAMIGPVCIAAGSLIIGLLLGSIAGWFGGFLDKIISAYADLTLSMPSLLLAIVAAAIIGGGYWINVLVMIVLYSPFDIRLVRSAVIQQKSKPYIESTRMFRLNSFRILAVHIFPNIAMVVMVNFFLNIAYGLMSMSSLSFLGLGVGPKEADWGRQIADGRELLTQNPAVALSAGIVIILTAVSINLIGSYLLERSGVDE
ncbi:MAG: ABC transporter permease [Oscillospiraceae bacterium]|jgi:peptide/nickel transport system permease protein|nr:ABC transporter permease [Oscillospiraceae bacterium]